EVITQAGDESSVGTSAVTGPVKARFVHQGLGLVNELNDVDNVALELRYSTKGTRIDWKRQGRVTAELCARSGLTIDIDAPVSRLTAVERTAVALARALYGAENGRIFL